MTPGHPHSSKGQEALSGGASWVGNVLGGRYLIRDVLGEGGIGFVLEAKDQQTGDAVAVKLLHDQFVDHESLRPRFEREAKALLALDHPHIVRITDHGVANGRPYLVTEKLEGRTLRDRMNAGQIPVHEALELTRQLLEGLAYAHELGVVHRDIKPPNIFLEEQADGSEAVKLIDFGFVKIHGLDDGHQLSTPDTAFGTPAYLPPEQVSGDASDGRSDVYSTGVILFEMLTGQQPFQGDMPTVVRQHLTAPVPPLTGVRPDLQITPELEAVVQRSMAKRKDRRFKDGRDFLNALLALPESSEDAPYAPFEMPDSAVVKLTDDMWEALAAGRKPTAPKATSGTTRRKKRDRRLVVIPLAAIMLTLAGITIYLSGSGDDDVVAPAASSTVERAHSNADEQGGEAAPHFVDPFEALSPVPLFDRARERLEQGEDIPEPELKRIKRRAFSMRADPRPHLLIATTYTRRRWFKDAVRKYERIAENFPDAVGSPQVLRDLVEIIRESERFRPRGRALVERLYGHEALTRVDEALAR